MRFVLSVVVLCAVALVGYWAIFAHLMRERVAEALINDAALEGRAGPVSGFPTQFRMTVEDLHWRAPNGTIAIHAPHADVAMPFFPPNRAHADLSREMVLELAGARSRLSHSGFRLDLTVTSGGRLQDAAFSLAEGQLDPAQVLDGAGAIRGRLERREAERFAVSLEAEEVTLAPELRATLDPQMLLPASLTSLSLVADLMVESPAQETDHMPLVQTVDLASLAVGWAGLEATLSGGVQRNARDLFDGQLRLEAAGWQGLYTSLVEAGAVDPNLGRLLGMVLASQTDAATGILTLGLEIRDSAISLGPVVLATLPRF